MDNVLLFITGVLSGIIVGFIISRSYSKKSRSNDASKESFLEENLFKAEKNLEETLLELNNQKKELKNNYKIKIDYLELRNINNLKISNTKQNSRLFIAYYLNNIRLIDNL